MLHGKKSSPWLEKRRKFRTWEQELQVIVDKRRPNIGSHVSNKAADIISKLLRLDWRTRLGCGERGSMDLKGHNVFHEIDWKALQEGEVASLVRPQAAAFSVENSEKTADKWVRDSLQNSLLNDPLSPEEQNLFNAWDYSIEDDPRLRPEFATMNTFASMDIKQARSWILKCNDQALAQLIFDVKKLHKIWVEENQELAMAQNAVEMLKGENQKLKDIIRKDVLGSSRPKQRKEGTVSNKEGKSEHKVARGRHQELRTKRMLSTPTLPSVNTSDPEDTIVQAPLRSKSIMN
mmetsp:Transcript_32747/g.45685  ORF Transcript_32747/g.45685 Transcript_32747/m.45685 type:complete len:291 (+) Transcript_32747:837-1709(+)